MTIEEQLDVLQHEYIFLWIELKILNKFYEYSDVVVSFDLGCTQEEQNLKRWQFIQLGVEIINPSRNYLVYLTNLSFNLFYTFNDVNCYKTFKLITEVKRGLDYYKDGKGFEIICEKLGSSKQVCGGGEYDGGIGFAIGIDRFLLVQ